MSGAALSVRTGKAAVWSWYDTARPSCGLKPDPTQNTRRRADAAELLRTRILRGWSC